VGCGVKSLKAVKLEEGWEDRKDPDQVLEQERRGEVHLALEPGVEGKTLDWVSIEPKREGSVVVREEEGQEQGRSAQGEPWLWVCVLAACARFSMLVWLERCLQLLLGEEPQPVVVSALAFVANLVHTLRRRA